MSETNSHTNGIHSALQAASDLRYTANELEHVIAEKGLCAEEIGQLTDIMARMSNLKSRIRLRRDSNACPS